MAVLLVIVIPILAAKFWVPDPIKKRVNGPAVTIPIWLVGLFVFFWQWRKERELALSAAQESN
jgi:hypothetical protein